MKYVYRWTVILFSLAASGGLVLEYFVRSGDLGRYPEWIILLGVAVFLAISFILLQLYSKYPDNYTFHKEDHVVALMGLGALSVLLFLFFINRYISLLEVLLDYFFHICGFSLLAVVATVSGAVSKKCSACGTRVSTFYKKGDRCPRCGAYWSNEAST